MTPPLSTAGLLLTEQDQRQLVDCMHTLLSPMDYPDLDAWRGAVTTATRTLVDADLASFEFREEGEEWLYSPDIDVATARMYRPLLQPLGKRCRIFERFRAQKVTNRERLWGPQLDEYRTSQYYHEFIAPNKSFDGLFAWTTLSDGRDAALYFHHERPDGPRFGDRGLALLRVLYPAFRAGLEGYAALARWRTSLLRSVDALSDAVALYSPDGELLHRNTALAGLLLAAPRADILERRMAAAARSAGEAARGGLDPESGIAAMPRQRVSIGAWRYDLTTNLLGPEIADGHLVWLTLTPAAARPASKAALQGRFGLTPRQAEVALLLAKRKTNAEVAEALCISPHTARRHTEKVMLKLGVGSRHEVGAAITIEPDV